MESESCSSEEESFNSQAYISKNLRATRLKTGCSAANQHGYPSENNTMNLMLVLMQSPDLNIKPLCSYSLLSGNS